MRMKFTDKAIKALKPKTERYLVLEENAHGQGTLGMRISPVGRKSWVFVYFFQGRPRMYTLGVYPEKTVAEAHQAHADAVMALERGEDPGAKALVEKTALKKAPTMTELAAEYLKQWAKPRKRSWKEDERILNRDVLPGWGTRKAQHITRRDVITLLDGIVDRGAPIAANRTLAVIRKVFNFAVSRDLVETSPCTAVSAPSRERRRERFLDETEIRGLLQRLPQAKMLAQSKLAIKFMLLTAQRCGEVLGAEWSDINLDFAWWTIPAEKAKNQMAHRVPLSPQALAVLKEVKALNRGEQFVFPSPRGDKEMTPTVLALAVRRSAEQFKMEHWTPHDLRRTAASHMTGMGVPRLVVSKILNHVEPGVTAVYDRHSYDSEKREALFAWGKKVAELEKDKPKLKVVRGKSEGKSKAAKTGRGDRDTPSKA
jgi:integrase